MGPTYVGIFSASPGYGKRLSSHVDEETPAANGYRLPSFDTCAAAAAILLPVGLIVDNLPSISRLTTSADQISKIQTTVRRLVPDPKNERACTANHTYVEFRGPEVEHEMPLVSQVNPKHAAARC